MRHSSNRFLPIVFVFVLVVPALAQVHNTATVTVASGPDKVRIIVDIDCRR